MNFSGTTKYSDSIITTSDSAILDECPGWINLMKAILEDLRICCYRLECIDMSK